MTPPRRVSGHKLMLALVSDLHGLTLPDVEPCDVFVIAGDICPDNTATCRDRRKCAEVQAQWFRLMFLPYLRQQLGVAERIVMIWGNHDFLGEFPELWPTLPEGVDLLHDSSVTISGVTFYGTPWVPNIPMWALARKHDSEIADKFAAIPQTTDVLISHGPALGTLDRVIGWHEPVGSPSLASNIARVNPQLHVFGHIHEGRGNVGNSYNVSAVNESYQPHPNPIVYVEMVSRRVVPSTREAKGE